MRLDNITYHVGLVLVILGYIKYVRWWILVVLGKTVRTFGILYWSYGAGTKYSRGLHIHNKQYTVFSGVDAEGH